MSSLRSRVDTPPPSPFPHRTVPARSQRRLCPRRRRPLAPTERPLPELGAKLPPIISSAQPAVDITQKVGPSVVGVIVKMNYVAQSGTSYEQDYGGGAGIVLTSDGYIVTNYHVVDTYDSLYAVVRGRSTGLRSLAQTRPWTWRSSRSTPLG